MGGGSQPLEPGDTRLRAALLAWGATLGGQRPLRGQEKLGGLQFSGFGFSFAHPA